MIILCSEEHFSELEQTVNDIYLVDEDGTGAVWAALRWTRDKKGRWRKSRKARKLTPFYALEQLRLVRNFTKTFGDSYTPCYGEQIAVDFTERKP